MIKIEIQGTDEQMQKIREHIKDVAYEFETKVIGNTMFIFIEDYIINID